MSITKVTLLYYIYAETAAICFGALLKNASKQQVDEILLFIAHRVFSWIIHHDSENEVCGHHDTQENIPPGLAVQFCYDGAEFRWQNSDNQCCNHRQEERMASKAVS